MSIPLPIRFPPKTSECCAIPPLRFQESRRHHQELVRNYRWLEEASNGHLSSTKF